jgi:uncharacterized protein YbbC (DUF1343 family)/CubicO group peptidase (beta-lactamase class C family)
MHRARLFPGCLAGLALLLAACQPEPKVVSTVPTAPAGASAPMPRPTARNPAEELRPARLAEMDAAINAAIASNRAPGAVLWLERRGAAYHKAYGQRAVIPAGEPMAEDTVFDAASLTKVIATTPALMKLVEAGKVALDASVTNFLPEFTGRGKEAITIRNLMTHSSGLRPSLPRTEPWLGHASALAVACAEPLPDTPNSLFRYSDINFIVLGFVVERVTGEPLEEFCAREIFRPLGLTNTGYRRYAPSRPLGLPTNVITSLFSTPVNRIAPTEALTNVGVVLRGVVHDPTARFMGGVAGHAGLFTTAADLARFSRMMLGGGELDGVRLFRPETVKLMTSVQSHPGLPRRGLGWDIDSAYAGQRGTNFPVGGYGHTGWTGTSLWIDPFSETFVIFLSNRNHPSEAGNIVALRRQLGSLAALAVKNFNFLGVEDALEPSPAPSSTNGPAAPRKPGLTNGAALNGIDVLKRGGFGRLRGKRVGLVTNHTGQDRERNPTVDLLHRAGGVELVALFSPEHGIRGALDEEKINDSTDGQTGLPIYSLYGQRRAPAPEHLAGLDVLAFDIQDIGCRFYTYISTMGNCLEAAARAKVPFLVLDRVNPLSGLMEGPLLTGERSFVGWHEIPLRHGLTAGELARLFNAERKFEADLTVIPCDGWSPAQWFDETGLPWQNPSPNMRSLTEATLYPGVGLLEFCNLSLGRGTGTPFELLGAPYIDDRQLAAEVNRASLPGVRCVPVRFMPNASVFANQECRGVQFLLTDRDTFRAADLGVTLAATLHRLYGEQVKLEKMARLLGDAATLKAIQAGKPLAEIQARWREGLAKFTERSRPHWLYPR